MGTGTMKRILKRVAVGVLIAVFLVLAFMLRFPSDPLVYCQKIINLGFVQWNMAHTNVFPNVEGDGVRSFAQAAEYMNPGARDGLLRDYNYVPGLKGGDPQDLVLLYLNRKTRRTWNGDDAATIRTKPRWMIIGPDSPNNGMDSEWLPEGGQLVDTDEFRRRLLKTLHFLKENDRPYWQTVVNEHTKFLDSIKE